MADPISTTIISKVTETVVGSSLKGAIRWFKKLGKKPPLSIEEIKKITGILFVDDEDFSSRLETIRGAGWVNVNQISDIKNYNSEEIKSADIVFMDYMNVGNILTPTQQGIGLLKGIKKRYPYKFLVFYSGHAGFIPGHEVHSIADAWIDKHADAYVYIDQIEAAAIKVHEPKK